MGGRAASYFIDKSVKKRTRERLEGYLDHLIDKRQKGEVQEVSNKDFNLLRTMLPIKNQF